MTRMQMILRSARWSVVDHLRRLGDALTGLYHDVRATVTRAVGQAAAGVVRDLLEVAGEPDSQPPPDRYPADADDWFEPGPGDWPDGEPPAHRTPGAESAAPSGRFWPAVRAGLWAALAWLFR